MDRTVNFQGFLSMRVFKVRQSPRLPFSSAVSGAISNHFGHPPIFPNLTPPENYNACADVTGAQRWHDGICLCASNSSGRICAKRGGGTVWTRRSRARRQRSNFEGEKQKAYLYEYIYIYKSITKRRTKKERQRTIDTITIKTGPRDYVQFLLV